MGVAKDAEPAIAKPIIKGNGETVREFATSTTIGNVKATAAVFVINSVSIQVSKQQKSKANWGLSDGINVINPWAI